MIGGLDQNGKSEEALIVFVRMVKSGVVPNPSTSTCAVSACANALSFSLSLQIHGHVFMSGFCLSGFVCASLILFYANCKRIEPKFSMKQCIGMWSYVQLFCSLWLKL
ncbi:hypothetical protein BT93_E0899 [Corymbia citriodora subsp. variegata]|nr:hypothetical protein BT93_E0899 [Corymbia citriodora subsp. variegata]